MNACFVIRKYIWRLIFIHVMIFGSACVKCYELDGPERHKLERMYEDGVKNLNTLGQLLGKKPLDPEDENKEPPKEVEDIYKTLEEHNVWERMKSWKRPLVSSEISNFSNSMQLGEEQLPETVKIYRFGNMNIVKYNDTSTGYLVLGVSFTSDHNLTILAVNLYHNGTELRLYANTCGKGICFIKVQQINLHQLLIVQKTSMLGANIRFGFVAAVSKADRIYFKLDLSPEIWSLEDALSIKSVPGFSIDHSLDANLTHSPENGSFTRELLSVWSTSSSIEHFEINTYPYFVSANNQDPEIQHHIIKKSNMAFFYTSVASTGNKTINGILNTVFQLRYNETCTINIYGEYNFLANSQHPPAWKPSIFTSATMGYYSVQPHSTADISFWISGMEGVKPIILLEKIFAGGAPLTEFPGFEVSIIRVKGLIDVRLLSYDVLPEDSGRYRLTVLASYRVLTKTVIIFVE